VFEDSNGNLNYVMIKKADKSEIRVACKHLIRIPLESELEKFHDEQFHKMISSEKLKELDQRKSDQSRLDEQNTLDQRDKLRNQNV
jgi:hypothetical protein